MAIFRERPASSNRDAVERVSIVHRVASAADQVLIPSFSRTLARFLVVAMTATPVAALQDGATTRVSVQTGGGKDQEPQEDRDSRQQFTHRYAACPIALPAQATVRSISARVMP